MIMPLARGQRASAQLSIDTRLRFVRKEKKVTKVLTSLLYRGLGRRPLDKIQQTGPQVPSTWSAHVNTR